MPLDIVFFPEELIQLNLEINHHPRLQGLLANHPPEEFEIRMAEICSYVAIILDGTYGPEDFKKLAVICKKRLEEMRPGMAGITIVHQMPEGLQ